MGYVHMARLFPFFSGGWSCASPQELAKTKADAQVHQSLGTALGRSILDWMDSCVVCLFFFGEQCLTEIISGLDSGFYLCQVISFNIYCIKTIIHQVWHNGDNHDIPSLCIIMGIL
jgi:hypothetical protein